MHVREINKNIKQLLKNGESMTEQLRDLSKNTSSIGSNNQSTLNPFMPKESIVQSEQTNTKIQVAFKTINA